jgi:hypothetical protein
MTRLGSSNDGGYIIPANMPMHVNNLLSFGLGMDCEFERQFDARGNLDAVHCYDHTVTAARVFRKGIGAALSAAIGSRPRKRLLRMKHAVSYATFFGQRHVKHFTLAISDQDTEKTRSCKSALQNISKDGGSTFLKCDIEGSEYLIIDQICDAAPRLTGLVIEFHDIVAEPDKFDTSMERLADKFAIVHIHPNNGGALSPDRRVDVLEISFVNRELKEVVRQMPPPDDDHKWQLSQDPHKLDAPNSKAATDIEIEYCDC